MFWMPKLTRLHEPFNQWSDQLIELGDIVGQLEDPAGELRSAIRVAIAGRDGDRVRVRGASIPIGIRLRVRT